MSLFLPDRVRVVRRCTVATEGVTVVDNAEDWFMSQLVVPLRGASIEQGTSPRTSSSPYRLRWSATMFGPGPLAPRHQGDRISDNTLIYEILSNPEEIRVGERIIGYEAACLPTGDLYPLSPMLEEVDGTPVKQVPTVVYTPSDTHGDRGTYENITGEAPVEFYDDLKIQNRALLIAGKSFRITSAVQILEAPHVSLSLRAPGP